MMTNINEPYIEPIDFPDRQDEVGAIQKRKKRRIDWLLIFLVIGGLLFFTVVITLGLALLLAPLFNLDLQNLRINYLPLANILQSLNLLQIGLLLLTCSLVLAIAFYLLARWRVVRNRSLWPEAGCPSCGDEVLERVSYKGRDRLFGWMGIPVGRYQCRSCDWNNIRIRKGPNVVANRDDWPPVITPMHDNGALLASAPPRELYWDHTEIVATNGAQVKWAKRLNDPVDLAAFEDNIASVSINDAAEADKISIEINVPDGVKLRADPQLDGATLGTLTPDKPVSLMVELTAEDASAGQHGQSDEQQSWVLRAFLKKGI